jgi:trans-2,3-dihydro-3-hydroxyanthranilate isomerase
MRKVKYFVLDVFTDTPLAGNPLAVFPDRTFLREDELQKVARELNLSETVFIEDPTDRSALRRLRIFTPAQEIPLAGHPVIGTWFLLASLRLVDLDDVLHAGMASLETAGDGTEKITFKHQLGAGVLPITIYRFDGKIIAVVMDQAKPTFGDQIKNLDSVAKALGIPKSAVGETGLPVQPVSTGIWALMVPVAERATLSKIHLNLAVLAELTRRTSCITTYTFCLDPQEDWAYVHARCFAPEVGVMEDPATGSAAGSMGAYLVKHGVIEASPAAAFEIEQGYEMGRPSRIGVEVTKEGGEIARVRVAGSAVVVAEAELRLPD